MAYKKQYGHIRVKILKVWPHFIDAKCVKTGRDVVFQLKWNMSDGLNNFLNSLEGTSTQVTIYCKPHVEKDMYWYSKISQGQHLGNRGRVKKIIAMENLMREVEKDYNPVNTGSIKQGLVLGRRGLPTREHTSGKIGTALIKNIHRPQMDELNKLTRKRPERQKALRSIRKRQLFIEEKYVNWCKENSLKQDDKTWEKFLNIYEDKGSAEKGLIHRLRTSVDIEKLLDSEEKEWARLRNNY